MLITIVVTSYNYQKYLKDTVNSILSQNFSEWEMIVVDDASSDSSVEILEEFAKNDNRIKLIKNEKNLGLCKSLQKGIKAASGEWIAFLESDDLWTENHLQKITEIIKKYPQTGLIFNDVEAFGDRDSVKGKQKYFDENRKFLKHKSFPSNMFFDLGAVNRIPTFSCVCIKKEELLKCDFSAPIDKFLDWWFYIHLARNNHFYYIPEKLTKWRLHRESYIKNKNKKKHLPMGLLALSDIIWREKDLTLIPYLIKTCFSAGLRLLKRAK